MPPEARWPPRRIVVIQICGIGDMLMASPAVTALREAFPDAHLTTVVGRAQVSLVERDPAYDGILVLDRDEPRAQRRQMVRRLREYGPDLAVDLIYRTYTGWLASQSGAPVRAGGGAWKMAWYRRRFYTHFVAPRPHIHQVEHGLDIVASLGIPARPTPMRAFFNEQDRASAYALLRSKGVDPDSPFMVVNPGAAQAMRAWAPERFAAVGDAVAKETGLPIVLCGADSDREAVSQMAAAMSSSGISIAGDTSLPQLAAILRAASLLVTGDTGPMHLAAAVGTPVAAVFGRSDPEWLRPWMTRHRIVQADLDCVPCREGWHSKRWFRCRDVKCMRAITPQAVAAAALTLLEETASKCACSSPAAT
jgi:heptosyltransferase-1